MKPFVKWAGGKEKEIKYFESQFPQSINNYFEPFLGGGSVFFYLNEKLKINKSFINDFSKELIDLYKCVKTQNKFFLNALGEIDADLETIYNYCRNVFPGTELKKEIDLIFENDNDVSNVPYVNISFEFNFTNIDLDIITFNEIVKPILKNKLNRLKKIQAMNQEKFKFESENFLETVLKSGYYAYIRILYNDKEKEKQFKERHLSYFYYLREYCYSSMFRFNSSDEFNVPYGGMAYNKKYFNKKIELLKSKELNTLLSKANIYNLDFEKFLKSQNYMKDDFVFVDPPYDTEFSEYDKNSFTRKDQTRLALCLSELKCKVMVVIKNTGFIEDLYLKLGFKIQAFDKKYSVNFMNRNVRDVEHLIITNY